MSPVRDDGAKERRGFSKKLSGIPDALASTPDKVFRLVAGYAVFLASIQVLTLGLSVAHVTISQPVAIAILLLSAAAGYLQWFFLRGLRCEPSSGEVSRPVGVKRSTILLFFGLVFYSVMWVEAYLKPDLSWDGIAYHIPTIHFWATKGYVHWITPIAGLSSRGVECWVDWQFPKVSNGFPFGAEVCAFAVVRAANNSQFVNTANLVYLPLGVLSLIYVSRTLGVRTHLACLSGVAYALLPVNVQQAATVMVDSAFASCVVGLMAALSFVMVKARGGRVPWMGVAPLGATVGLTAGSKVWGPAVIAPAVIGLASYLLLAVMLTGQKNRATSSGQGSDVSRRGQRVRSTVPSRWRLFGSAVVFVVAVCATATTVGGYWFIRNYLMTGNPVWPGKVSIGQRVLFPYAYSIDSERERRAFPAPKLWLQGGIGDGAKQWPRSLRPHHTWWGGAGFLWILGCLPAVIVVVLWSLVDHGRYLSKRGDKPAPYGSHLIALLLIAAGAFWLIPSGGRIRYTLWIYGIGLPCFFVAVQWLLQRKRWWLKPWWWFPRLWIWACLALLVFEGVYCLSWQATRCYMLGSPDWPRFRMDPIRAARSFVWHDPVGYIFPQLSTTVFEEVLTGNDAVALAELKPPLVLKLIIGQLCFPIGARKVFFLDHDTAKNQEALSRFLEEHRIRYVVWDPTIPVPDAMGAFACRDVRIPRLFRVLEFPVNGNEEFPLALKEGRKFG